MVSDSQLHCDNLQKETELGRTQIGQQDCGRFDHVIRSCCFCQFDLILVIINYSFCSPL